MAGRRPKPTHLKIVAGNPGKRSINRREPTPRREIPSCPAHLGDAAKVAWGRLVEMLDRIGVLTEGDSMALERLCDCYADILACRELIERDGRTYTVMTAQGDTLIKGNPAVAQLRAADAQLKSYLVELGLTPAARSKIQVTDGDEKPQDAFKEFFG